MKKHFFAFVSFCVFCLGIWNSSADAAQNGGEIWRNYFEKNDTGKALAAFEESLKANPKDFLAHAGLAMLSGSRNSDLEPVDNLLNALEFGSSEPESLLFLHQALSLLSGKEEYETALARIDQILTKTDVFPQLTDALLFTRANLLRRVARWDESKKTFSDLHFLTSFWYAGPFDNAEKGGHDRIFGPEENLDLNATYPGKRGEVSWRPIPVQPYDGFINLHGFISPSKEAVVYLTTNLRSEIDQFCKLQFGNAGAMKVWLNGEPLADVPRYHSPYPGQVNAGADLKKGDNVLLVKISSNQTGRFGLYARIVADNSSSVQCAELTKESESVKSSTPKAGKKPDANAVYEPEALQKLKEMAEAASSSPVYSLFYALLLQSFDVSDEADPSVNKMLSDLNSKNEDNPLILRYLGDSEKQENRKRTAWNKAITADPKDQACFVRLLRYYLNSPYATKLMDMIRGWEKENEVPQTARLIEAQFLSGKGMRDAAVDLLRAVLEKEDMPEANRLLYDIGSPLFGESENKKLLLKLLDEDASNINIVHTLRKIAMRDGDAAAIEKYLNQEKAIQPFSIAGYVDMVHYYQAAGDYKRSLEYISEALKVSPDDFECHRLSAIAYNNLSDRSNALRELSLAMKIQPSDPWCLQYTEFLKPEEENYASPYRRDWKNIKMPDKFDLSKANYLNILDQRVIKVHQNGNSSETIHMVCKILTDNGVKDKQADGIYYQGGTEDIRILKARVWKPDGTFLDAPAPERRSTASASDAAEKLYGDSYVAIIRYPALEKGATIELEYEKEKKGDNIYADYFGDLFYAGDPQFEPTLLSENVLITPASRDFYWKYVEPHYPASVSSDLLKMSKEPKVTASASEKTYQWVFENLPAVPQEPYMPQASEILPYIKVSTFKTWKDMTTWYWNLMKDQIIPGQPLRESVKQAIFDYRKKKGFDAEKELSAWDKVRAINEFVNTGVRYLGLEFGINGYKPHKVDEICNARYGDCKDKAALAVAMLKEVGIDARFVIFRTAHLGEIDYELPSLGIFNHAIYYLPDMNGKEYWIDGTATFHDAKELPSGDEGSNSLIVKPGGEYEFKRVPHSLAEVNGAVYTTSLTLDEEGTAKGFRNSEFRGLYNPMVRRMYENTAKAKEMLDRVLVSQYPGSRTWNVELSDLKDYSKPERLAYELEVTHFGVARNDEMLVPSTLYKENFSNIYAQLPTREFDEVLGYAWKRSNILKIQVFPNQKIQLPGNREIKTEFGGYVRTCEIKDGTVQIKEDLWLDTIRVPKEKYADFREFCRLVDLYQDEKFSVKLQG